MQANQGLPRKLVTDRAVWDPIPCSICELPPRNFYPKHTAIGFMGVSLGVVKGKGNAGWEPTLFHGTCGGVA